MNVNWEGILPIQGEIIIVEDDPTLRMLMVDIVSEIGGVTKDFFCADDALTYLLQTPGQCCLVIADHGVPGQVQGTEFIEMIQCRWPWIGAILTSGYALDLATVPPAALYLHKPWSLDELVLAITATLQPEHPIKRA